MPIPNQIQKLLDEYYAKNTPEATAKKQILEQEIIDLLNKLSTKIDPVFKEFSDNPLNQLTYPELIDQVNNYSNMANSNERIIKPAKMLIIHLNNYLLYKCFCRIENCLRNEDVNLEDIFTYKALMVDIVDDVYDIKNEIDISTKDLLTYSYFLAFKDYAVTLFVPMVKYMAKYKPKKHVLNPQKNDPIYKILEAERSYILHNDLLSQSYKNFVFMYKNELRNSKMKKALS